MVDEIIFYRRLSDTVWFRKNQDGKSSYNEPRVRDFLQNFYLAFCRRYGLCEDRWEQELLSAFVDYNVLLSPKPAWKPQASYTFPYDVHGIWQDMSQEIHRQSAGAGYAGSKGRKGGGNGTTGPDEEDWANLSASVRGRLARLLSDSYLAKKRGPITYAARNPWRFSPSRDTADWLLSARGKQCIVSPIDNESADLH